MHVTFVDPWVHPKKLPQHHHVSSLSTLVPSCTKNKIFDHYLPIKTLFVALYATVFKRNAYVRGFCGIFYVWPALYTEKLPIFVWAKMTKLGWPKKLIWPWKFKIFISKWRKGEREFTWIKRGGIPLDDAHGILFWNSGIKCTMVGENSKWYENF